MVRNAYQDISSEYETLIKAFDKDCANFLKRVGKDRTIGTYKVMIRAWNHVATFIKSFYKRNDMSMLELTPDFIKEFAAYLTAERNLKNATIWLNCMWLKGVVMRAHYNGLIPRNPFAQFHISPNVKEREYLTEDEIKTIMSHEFKSPTLTLVRDLFVFACFTALSFVNMKELTTDEIVEVNGEKWIIGKRHKTNVPFQVKLLDIPLQIIERYKHLSKDKLVFGEINYWTMCKQLKRVIKECGIEKQVSYHCARHTDRGHPHCHIVFNRVDNDGKTVSDKNDRYRNEKVCKMLTAKYMLHFANGKDHINEERLQPYDKAKHEVYNALKEGLPHARSWEELKDALSDRDIELKFKASRITREVQGVKFEYNGISFSGSKVSREFSYMNIDYQLRRNAFEDDSKSSQTISRPPREEQQRTVISEHSNETGLGFGLFSGIGSSSNVADMEANQEMAEILRKKKKAKRKRGFRL